MKKVTSIKTRIWATIAHIPLITIIWGIYVVYVVDWSSTTEIASLDMLKQQCSSVPTRPLIFTICSLPISLSIMFLKKRSAFIKGNAEEAFHFNIWLLKQYLISASGIFIGVFFSFKLIAIFFQLLVALVSINCLLQSSTGVITAARGMIYRYWYPPIL